MPYINNNDWLVKRKGNRKINFTLLSFLRLVVSFNVEISKVLETCLYILKYRTNFMVKSVIMMIKSTIL